MSESMSLKIANYGLYVLGFYLSLLAFIHALLRQVLYPINVKLLQHSQLLPWAQSVSQKAKLLCLGEYLVVCAVTPAFVLLVWSEFYRHSDFFGKTKLKVMFGLALVALIGFMYSVTLPVDDNAGWWPVLVLTASCVFGIGFFPKITHGKLHGTS